MKLMNSGKLDKQKSTNVPKLSQQEKHPKAFQGFGGEQKPFTEADGPQLEEGKMACLREISGR